MLWIAAFILVARVGIAPTQGDALQASFVVEDTVAPAAVTDLSVIGSTTNSVTLTWTAPGDDGNYGNASQYDIRYSNSSITNDADWDADTTAMAEPVPSPAGSIETFVVAGLGPASSWCFAIKTADGVPNWSGLSNTVCSATLGGSAGWVVILEGGVDWGTGLFELKIDMWGKVTSGERTASGILLETLEAVSDKGEITLVLHEGTAVTDPEGNAVEVIWIEPMERPSQLPLDAQVVEALELSPLCLFSQAVEMTIHYDAAALGEGVEEQDLFIAWFDQGSGEWAKLPAVADTGNQTVTASLTHSSVVALLAAASSVTPTPTPTPSLGLGVVAWIAIPIGVLILQDLIAWVVGRRGKVEARAD